MRRTLKAAVWYFILKHEFWFSCLLMMCLHLVEWRLQTKWMGELAFLIFAIALTRLAMHPMWKKAGE